jgi:opacity protein-like surface antigen
MKKLLSVVALSALLASSHAMAGKNYEPVDSEVVPIDMTNPFYIGIGGVWTGVSRDCTCRDTAATRLKDSTYGEILRVGYDFNPFFGIEARALQGNLGINFAKTTHYGVYMKPQYHITPLMNVYALAGYGHTTVECTIAGKAENLGTKDFTKNGFSFGAGVEYDLSGDQGIQGDAEEGWGLFVDWQNLAYKDTPQNTNVNVVSAGITYDF